MTSRFGIQCSIAIGLFLPSTGLGQTALTKADFEAVHRLLQPTEEEAWRKVPWKLSILEAQNQAAKEKKPVFMLVRSGHPLGCV